jgi:hypothetical protein
VRERQLVRDRPERRPRALERLARTGARAPSTASRPTPSYVAGRNEGLSFCTYERGFSGRGGYATRVPAPPTSPRRFSPAISAAASSRSAPAVGQRSSRSRAQGLLKDGIPNPHQRATEVDASEDLTRSGQIETKIAQLESRCFVAPAGQ